MMKIDDFDFVLPEELIAIYPRKKRSSSKLLVLKKCSGEITHSQFSNLPEFLDKSYLIVYNNTKVIPARIKLKKETGGKIEILLDHPISENEWSGIFSASKRPKEGSLILNNDEPVFRVIEVKKNMIRIKFLGKNFYDFLNEVGEVPLPPYILKRRDGRVIPEDKDFYQTIFAKKEGAVAAPTAGIHFDENVWNKLKLKGIEDVEITLHVGIGTFLPIKEKEVEKHKMHAERVEITKEAAQKIIDWKEKGGKILAVGTTTVRTLEGVAEKLGKLDKYQGTVDIFIYPGYKFKIVDAMITNFHLPKSTLLLLVSAFAGKDKIINAYKEAIERKYHFFSYGDAMLIL